MRTILASVFLAVAAMAQTGVYPVPSPLAALASTPQGVNRFNTGLNTVFEGDSLTAGYTLSKSAYNTTSCKTSLSDATCQDWPSQLVLMSSLQGRVISKTNFAIAGNKISDLQGRYTTSVHPLSPAVTGVPAILFVWVGANDYEQALSASTIESSLTTYWAGAKTDGFTLAVGTIMHYGGNVPPANELVRQQVNSWIRTQFQTGAYDYLLDFDREFQNPYDGTFFAADHIHLNQYAAYLNAKMINGVLWDDSNPAPVTTDGNAIGTGIGNARGGFDSLSYLTTGHYDSAFGFQSLFNMTTGYDNSGFGFQSLYLETTGTYNSCFGYYACGKQVGQNFNTGVGYGALYQNLKSYDTAVGYQAGVNQNGSGNTFLGANAGLNTTGSNDVAVGYNAFTVLGTGTDDVMVGVNAGISVTGSQVSILGYNSGANISGNNNTILGAQSGTQLTSGASNTLLGAYAEVAATATGSVEIGARTNSVNNTLAFQGKQIADSNGYLYSNTTTPASSSATCTAGAIWADATYMYACTATNTIKRAVLSSF